MIDSLNAARNKAISRLNSIYLPTSRESIGHDEVQAIGLVLLQHESSALEISLRESIPPLFNDLTLDDRITFLESMGVSQQEMSQFVLGSSAESLFFSMLNKGNPMLFTKLAIMSGFSVLDAISISNEISDPTYRVLNAISNLEKYTKLSQIT